MNRPCAEDLAATLALADPPPVCQTHARRWRHWEATLETATTKKVKDAARAHLLSLCEQCPFQGPGACHDLAQADEFTGVAAGAIWQDGIPTTTTTGPRAALAG